MMLNKTFKPILFNTRMTQEILKGKKTQTRRIINVPSDLQVSLSESRYLGSDPVIGCFDEIPNRYVNFEFPKEIVISVKVPYLKNDNLYVRETWSKKSVVDACTGYVSSTCPEDCVEDDRNICNQKSEYIYRADFLDDPPGLKWKPSIHMPKDAARIFLKVTDVRIERLQDITSEDAKEEGANFDLKGPSFNVGFAEKMSRSPIERFKDIWNSTTNNKLYQWDNNPWVEVIEFERTS